MKAASSVRTSVASRRLLARLLILFVLVLAVFATRLLLTNVLTSSGSEACGEAEDLLAAEEPSVQFLVLLPEDTTATSVDGRPVEEQERRLARAEFSANTAELRRLASRTRDETVRDGLRALAIERQRVIESPSSKNSGLFTAAQAYRQACGTWPMPSGN